MCKQIPLLLLLLVLLLAMPVVGATAETVNGMRIVSCPEQNFSTLVDFDCTNEWSDRFGLYFYLEDPGYIPNIRVFLRTGEDRVTDGEAYINDVVIPTTREDFGGNGAMQFIQHGGYSLGDKPMANVEMEYYDRTGTKIYAVTAVEIQENYSVAYRLRYADASTRESMLHALDTVAAYLQPDANYYSGGAIADKPAVSTQSPGSADALSFTVTDIVQNGMVMGRCTAPAGYTVSGEGYCCTLQQSAGNPWQLGVTALSPDASVMLSYASMRDFYTENGAETQDGTFNLKYYTPMLHYMTASEYCDYWAAQLNTASGPTLVEENSFPHLQARLDRQAEAFKNTVNAQMSGLGLSADEVAYTMAQRRYALTAPNGVDYYFVVSTVTRGTWYTATLPGPLVTLVGHYILWDAPYVYSMLCPVDQWEQASAMFTVFTENTSVSDQFLLANQRLSSEIWSVLTGIDLTGGKEMSEGVMREETTAGDDYDDERYTDYIFDQNDYTLSDGRRVKVSTAYDYVYEGDNGTVYYSDSAFAQPGGSTQLYPNR